MLFRKFDISVESLTFFVNDIYFSSDISNKSILPSYVVAISLIIKCES